jgi:hypothetical protein
MRLTGENRNTRGKTCPSATLSTTNPTWTDPGSNPDLRGGRPATNRHARSGTLQLLFFRSEVAYCFHSFGLSQAVGVGKKRILDVS